MTTGLEEQLREAMVEHTEGLDLAPGTARAALDRAARARRLRTVAGSAGFAAVTAGAVVAGVAAASAGPLPTSSHNPVPASGHGSTPPMIKSPRQRGIPRPPNQAEIQRKRELAAHSGRRSQEAPPVPAALKKVALPNPAPGFALRRATDMLEYTSSASGKYWADTFVVAQTHARCVTGKGGAACSPTGPEATVIVSLGHQPTRPDRQDRIAGARVVRTAQVDGRRGYVTVYRPRYGAPAWQLYAGVGRFAVYAIGDHGATVQDLVRLADSLHGL